MPRKKKQISFEVFDKQVIEHSSGLKDKNLQAIPHYNFEDENDVPQSIQKLINFLCSPSTKKPEEMYCFIMYDIEDNKVRRLVAKYLEKKGCIRVQKSIFFAKLHRNMYREVSQTLKEIQEAYTNADSVLVLPVGEDMLGNLLVIGKAIEFELMTNLPNTLFF